MLLATGGPIGVARHRVPCCRDAPSTGSSWRRGDQARHLPARNRRERRLLYRMTTWCDVPDDVVAHRLDAVQLSETAAATTSQDSNGFRVDFETLQRWLKDFEPVGIEGRVPKKLGPRRASRPTEETKDEIAELHGKEWSSGEQVGVASTPISSCRR